MVGRHSKSRSFCAVRTLAFHILRKKKYKNITKNHIICLKHEEEENVKAVKMHTFLVCAYKSQNFVQRRMLYYVVSHKSVFGNQEIGHLEL